MPRTRIKICGVCRPEDAATAARLGAHAVGMIRHEAAARNVSMAEARQIARVLPPSISAALLYVNSSAEEILQDLQEFGYPALVQLNGDEPITTIAALAEAKVNVFKAVRIDADVRARLKELRKARLPNLTGVVLETPGQIGGSGVENDWATVVQLIADHAFLGLPPITAAGGLHAENVGAVIRLIHPFGVDVSSGVDETKRQKSEPKIAAFIAAVRQADH